MGAPERLRDWIVLIGGELVGDRGGRPVRRAAVAVEPPQAVAGAGPSQHRQRRRGNRGNHHEQQEADGARQRRQHNPEACPGKCKEQPKRRRQRGQSRPQPLPQQAAARALKRPREQSPGRIFLLLWLLVQSVQKPLRRVGLRRICRRTGYHAGNSQAMRGVPAPKANPACDRAQSIGQLQGAGEPPTIRRL